MKRTLTLIFFATFIFTATRSFAQSDGLRNIDHKILHKIKDYKCAIIITGSVTNVNCYGDQTGAIDITVTHTWGKVSYLWSDGSTDEDRTNLAAGTYSVTVTDETKRKATATFEVTQPAEPLIVKPRVRPESSPGACDGGIALNISGGNPLYSITWNDGSTDPCRTDLCPGNYGVCVTDASGCAVTTKITVPAASSFSVSDAAASSIVLKGSLSVLVSPNPTKGMVQVAVNAKANGTAVINVYDMSGKKMITNKFAVAKGTTNRSIDLGRYSKGFYHVELLVDGQKKVVKVLLQ